MGINYKSNQPIKKSSYSSLNVYDQCPFKYYLQYVQKHYVYVDSLASDFGTLCHFILEHIGLDLKEGREPDYEKYKKDFKELNIPKKDAFDHDGGFILPAFRSSTSPRSPLNSSSPCSWS